MPEADFTRQQRPPRRWTPVADRRRPVIFLRKLVLLESLPPLKSKPLREVDFRAGLNIVWANPRTAEARTGGTRWAGHSAGKTTLCRILRWLLGEGNFASQQLEAKIASTLKDGWAILEVELDGQPWLTGRRFFHKDNHCAVQGLAWEEFFAHSWPDPASAEPFLAELDRLTIHPLQMRRFPGREHDIAWTNLLAWLARDQETALVDIATWRSSAKTSSVRSPTDAERHLLLRLVLEMIDAPEFAELEHCEVWDRARKVLKDNRPTLLDRLEQACARLSPLIPQDGPPLAGDLILSPARKAMDDKNSQLARTREILKEDSATAAERIHRQAHAALTAARRDLRGAEQVLAAKKAHHDSQENALLLAEQKIKQVSLQAPPGLCGAKRPEAEAAHCTAFKERPVDFDLAALLVGFTKSRDDAFIAWQEAGSEVETCRASIHLLEQNDETTRFHAETARREREQQLADAARLEAEFTDRCIKKLSPQV